MLKKIVLTIFAITIISGVSLTINSLFKSVSNADVPSNPKPSASKESVTNSIDTDSLASELSTADETKGVPLSDLRDIIGIITHHGNFVRAEEQTIFDEYHIAREKKQIGPNTIQIILDYGIFLREEF